MGYQTLNKTSIYQSVTAVFPRLINLVNILGNVKDDSSMYHGWKNYPQVKVNAHAMPVSLLSVSVCLDMYPFLLLLLLLLLLFYRNRFQFFLESRFSLWSILLLAFCVQIMGNVYYEKLKLPSLGSKLEK
jgi:hypothetical protein